jgi:hypothetical protein
LQPLSYLPATAGRAQWHHHWREFFLQQIVLRVRKLIIPQADSDYELSAAAGDGNREEGASAFGLQYTRAVGWELNVRQKPELPWVNLRPPLLDQNHLAILAEATNLNLKLIKLRMILDLDVDMLQSTRVLQSEWGHSR